jgi:hypothetical protein
MKKEIVVGTVAVFVVWGVMDFIIHGVLLSSLYAANPELWRPMAEMKIGVMYGAILISALFFTLLYELGLADAPLRKSVLYGAYFGVAIGIGMGFGTYSVQPIPLSLAVSWFVGTIVESIAGALAVHWAFRSKKQGAQ